MRAISGSQHEPFRPATWTLAFLALSAALTAGAGLLELVQGLEAGLVIPTVLAGFLAGWLLARPGKRLRTSLFLLLAAGVLFQMVFAGQLAGKFGLLALAWARSLPGLPAWAHGDFSTWEPVRLAWPGLVGGVNVIAVRIGHWAAGAGQGAAPFDPLIPSLAWGWVLWAVSGWTACALRRRYNPFTVLFPALVLLAGGYGLVRRETAALLILLGILLVMAVLSAQLRREQDWTARGLDYSLEIRFDVSLYAILIFLLAMGAAAWIPSIPWDTLFKSPERASSPPPGAAESVIRSFGLQLPTRVPTVLDAYYAPGLPRAHLVGSGPELSQQVAMTVHLLSARTEEALPTPGGMADPTGGTAAAPQYYWRAFTYDRYTGSGWLTSPTTSTDYPANTRLTGSRPAGEDIARFEIQESQDLGGVLYYSGSLVAVDQRVTLQSRSGGDAFAGYLAAGDYRVEVAHPAFDPAVPRQAGEDYPNAVKRIYLQLPENLPNRVISLARELTATAANPYDRAVSIEEYLHGIPYTLDLPAPPPDRDVVDYFLFDLKKGYCDDFASAMVVLARVAGIPARLVVGYAPGRYDSARRVYTVTEADAHSWAELYLPKYGWVEFEPTPGIQGGSTAPSLANPPIPFPYTTSSPARGNPSSRMSGQIPWGLAAIPAALAGLGLLAYAAVRDRRLQLLGPQNGLESMYRRMRGSGVAVSSPSGLTPNELAGILEGGMFRLAERRWIGRVFTPAVGEIATLINLYVREAYSARQVTLAEYAQEFSQWRKLRLRLWLAERVKGWIKTHSS